MKDMSNEELINKFRAMCSLFIIYGKFQKEQDFNEANKISDKLLSHLAAGEEAVKKVDGLEKEVERLKATAVCIYCNKTMIADNGKDKLSMMIDHMSLCDKHPMYKIGGLLAEIDQLKADKRELVKVLEMISEWPFDFIADAIDEARSAIAKHKEAL